MVWRDTMADQMIVARNFSYEVKEHVTADLKDSRFDFDKVVTANINHYPETYNTKAILYYPDFNQYV